MKKVCCFIVALLLISCSPDRSAQQPGGSSLPAGVTTQQPRRADSQYALEVRPAEATRHSILSIIPKGFGFADAKIEWLVNGISSESTGRTFDTANVQRGDVIQGKATIQGKEILSNTVEVGDTPPEWTSIKLMPEVFKPGDTLYVDAAGKDVDDDPVTISYDWTVNGQPAGTEKSVGAPVKRGDKVSVKVSIFDGQVYGQPVVLTREIGNMPPMIEADNTYKMAGGVFTHRCRATDPDGDTLTWSLKAAPAGMKIDPATGMVTWPVPPDFIGKKSFTVIAKDGHGGQSAEIFTFTVSEAEASK